MRRAPPLLLLGALSCAFVSDEPRSSAAVSATLARSQQAFFRARGPLVAGMLDTMACDLFSYYRGNITVFARDWRENARGISSSRFAVEEPVRVSLGDPHPENFGILRDANGVFAFEPNDFDSADRLPYLWDLRRLLVGLAIAARRSNSDNPTARAAAVAAQDQLLTAAARAYAETLRARADGAAPARITDGSSGPLLADLFDRAQRDLAARAELTDFTTVDPGPPPRRRFLRGAPDPASPQNVLEPLSPELYAALPEALERYRVATRPELPREYFQLLDAARELGSGVASWPRVRIQVLLRGPTEDVADDVLLELKEELDPGLGAWWSPDVRYDTLGQRLLQTTRAAWNGTAEPFWSSVELWGLTLQVKLESAAHKTLRVSRMVRSRGTVDALTSVSRVLGSLLARVHAGPAGDPEALAIAQRIASRIDADREGFVREQVTLCHRYADQVELDFATLRADLRSLGPLLGVPVETADLPSPSLRALLGVPVPPQGFDAPGNPESCDP